MIAEVKVLLHVDDVVEVVFVFPLYYVQNLQLNQSLVMKPADLQEMLRYWKILHVISSFISEFPGIVESELLNMSTKIMAGLFGNFCVHSCS